MAEQDPSGSSVLATTRSSGHTVADQRTSQKCLGGRVDRTHHLLLEGVQWPQWRRAGGSVEPVRPQ
ncbi:hypothetical protein BST27_25305 [Mycobacterium intermedium]|uniref:Uncharacterized protein n=1 Tax=Mycobacterium intermedium TaxID=28445 RepID=A0A1X0F418_MYCIE|nr:hypothetical protein BST27_25305 [Mycobacterium intermedium]